MRHEDCLSARDFFLRRTDLGYTRRSPEEGLVSAVLERLARGLGWSRERREADRAALQAALEGLQAWRAGDAGPSTLRRAE